MREYPKTYLLKLMIKKANIIKDHLKRSIDQLIIVANIGPTMEVFKLYDTKEEDSLKLCMTLSNLGDIEGTNTSIMAASKLPVAATLFSM